MTTKKEKAEQVSALGDKLVGLLNSQQARDAGIEDAGKVEGGEDLQAAIGFTHEGDEYFVTLDPA